MTDDSLRAEWLAHADRTRDNFAERDFRADPLRVLSMGGGVQSTAMVHYIADGILDRPDLILMSDTGSEHPDTEAHISGRLKSFIEDELKIPFVIVTAYGWGTPDPAAKPGETMLPRSTLHEDFRKIRKLPLIGNRSCTSSYKVEPFRRYIRSIVGQGNGEPPLVEVWLGITSDEDHRARSSDVKWLSHHYPLIENGRSISRVQCSERLIAAGWGDTIKSGCFMCPYQGRNSWLTLQREHPDLWDIAVEMDTVAGANGVRMGLWNGTRPKGRLKELAVEVTLADFGLIFETDVDPGTCDHEGGGCFL